MNKYQQIIIDEYSRHNQTPVYYQLGSEKLPVPYIYGSDVDSFIDDLFSFQDKYYLDYESYNQKHPQAPIDIPDLRLGDIHVIPRLSDVRKGLSAERLLDKINKTAQRRYRSAVKKTLRAAQEYPDKDFLITLHPKELHRLDNLHYHYCLHKIGHKIGASAGWTVRQTAQILAGATGALPLAAFYLLDNKYHFASSKVKKCIDNKRHYVFGGFIKGISVLTLAAGIKFANPRFSDDDKSIPPIEQTVNNSPQEDNAPLLLNLSQQRYDIKDKDSFNRLFDATFPLITGSMLPTEILVCNPYSDNGKEVSNTIGIGSFWFPKDGNFQSSDWIKTSQYIKAHPKIKVSGQQATDLVRGWFCHREGGRIYKEMRKRLRGAQLTPNEFAAIANCIYNDEENGKKLCDFVRQNWQNPVKCAHFLMSLKPGNSSFNDGILKRHTHEALLYLNVDNYVHNIPDFLIKEGINSKGNKYYVSSVTQLTSEDCRSVLNELAGCKGGVVGGQTLLIAQKIVNYSCRGGQTLQDLAKNNGLGDLKQQINEVMLNNKAPQRAAEHLSSSSSVQPPKTRC